MIHSLFGANLLLLGAPIFQDGNHKRHHLYTRETLPIRLHSILVFSFDFNAQRYAERLNLHSKTSTEGAALLIWTHSTRAHVCLPAVPRQEIEISSSDDGEILAAAPAGARDKSYSDDSDVEDEPIGHHRKRARTGNNGHGNLVANATQKRRESNESPAVSKPKQTARANGRSPSPQSARSSGKDRSTGTARQDTSSSSSESADMQEVGKHSKGDDQRPAAVATPFSLSRHQRTGGERPVPEVVVSPRSFDLQEDAVRRKNFQEGLIVSLREDTGDRSIPEAGRVGDQGGEGSAEEGTAPSAAAAADSNESSGKTKAAALRRKGKGKAGGAAGRVKLTPMEQQVSDLKAQHPGVLLLVECGYRYRFFGDDALIAAKVRVWTQKDRERWTR